MSAFDCNGNRNGRNTLGLSNGGSLLSPGGRPAPPPEPVTLVAQRSQIVEAKISFNTPRANEHRQCLHSKCILDDGSKVFIFRQQNGWTTVHLNSSADNPQLTTDPTSALRIAYPAFMGCAGVSTVTIRKADGTIVPFDQIAAIEYDDLPVGGPAADSTAVVTAPSSNKSDAQIIHDEIIAQATDLKTNVQILATDVDDIKTKMTALGGTIKDMFTSMDTKLAHLVRGIDKDSAAPAPPPSAAPTFDGGSGAGSSAAHAAAPSSSSPVTAGMVDAAAASRADRRRVKAIKPSKSG